MTPDEAPPESGLEEMLTRMLAFDAMLNDRASADDDRPDRSPETVDDDRCRSRLLLLLRMLEAAEATPGAGGAGRMPSIAEEPGRFLGRFQYLEGLGSGGFGFVMRARDRVLGREVALKLPLPERLLAPDDLRRFAPRGPRRGPAGPSGIVRVFDAGELGPMGYLHRLGVLRRAEPAEMAARAARAGAAATGGAVGRGPGRRRAARARPRHPPPRHQARQRHPGDGLGAGRVPAPLTDFGLAKVVEEGARRRGAGADRHADLHGAGAGGGASAGDRADGRRLRAGGDAL